MTELIPYKQRLEVLDRNLKNMSPQFAVALGTRGMSAEKLVRVIRTVVQNNAELLKADYRSLLAASIQCAQLGLSPDPMLGEAYMVPYKGRVQLQAGYKGLKNLAFNHTSVVGISAGAVHESDEFDFDDGSAPFIRHKVNIRAEHPGPIIAGWARAELRDAKLPVIKVIPRWFIDKVKAFSKAKTGPWSEWEDAMVMKTAMKQLVKLIPASAELRSAASLDDQAEADIPQNLESALDDLPPVEAELVP